MLKRENNILTAKNLSSLRSLAAQNGVEPTLRIPAKGILLVKISPKLFTRVGYPLFIKPYSVFTNKLTQVNLFDVYQGNGVAEGHKSLAISLVIQDNEKTLEEDEIKYAKYRKKNNRNKPCYFKFVFSSAVYKITQKNNADCNASAKIVRQIPFKSDAEKCHKGKLG